MQEYPHIYKTSAEGQPKGIVKVKSPGLATIDTTPPPEFGGPEGQWSPETLMIASVTDCFIMTFRAIARASRLEWNDLECEAEGKLEKFNGIARFTFINLRATLSVPIGTRKAKANQLLHMAETNCMITNSMSADIRLDTIIEVASDQQVA